MRGFELRSSSWLVGLALTILGGCNAGPPSFEPRDSGPEPTILSFSASSETITEGQTTTLTWSTANVTEVRLFEGEEEILQGDAARGSIDVRPIATVAFTLVAGNETGRRTTAEVVVEVVPAVPEVPRITRFEAQPPTIQEGSTSTLRWSVQHTTSVALFVGDEELHTSSSPEGFFDVAPERTTTYHLVATGPGGKSTAEAQVVVAKAAVAPRILRFEVAPNLVTASPTAPATVTLSWQIEGAERVELVASPGGPVEVDDLTPGSHELSVEVGETTSFTLTDRKSVV